MSHHVGRFRPYDPALICRKDQTGPMTAPTHPGDRPSLRTFVSALAVTGVLSALAVCAAVAVAPGAAR
ncbi:hypothetical protein GT039_42425, partial [Streptomyces sp. SID2955]|nr:hypothetical protein [Streptomyces sp. SID2955]